MSRLSRRAFTRFALRLAALWTTGAQAASAGDRGFGGTGAVPVDPEDTIVRDRGLGGTGVVGTIRRFGSIVVNDLRVTYPADVRVTVDGVRATAGDLRIGHVVRVLARTRGGGMLTRAIAVTNEVVGPVEALGRGSLIVLGQRVLAGPGVRGDVRLGRIVAVAGLRRPDGTIVASLIAPRTAGTPPRLAGPVTAGPGGAPRIGGLDIVGLRRALIGRRVVLTGRRVTDAFQASDVTVEPAVPFAGADRLSIEGYLARSGATIRFGSGVALAVGRVGSELDDGQVVRAVVTAAADGRGVLAATDIHVERGPRESGPGPGQRTPGEPGPPGMPERSMAPGPGSPPAGPGASPRSGPAGGGTPGGAGGSGGPGGGPSR